VPGGTYHRSYDGIDFTDQSNPATLTTFALDRFEVTVGRFRAFVDAGKGNQQDPPSAGDGVHPLISNSGWQSAWDAALPTDTTALQAALKCSAPFQTWTDVASVDDALPMNCVNWYEAFAFCAWDGGRLPTEAEWNYAASGGDEQRYYPWSAPYPPGSTTIDGTYAVYDDCCGIPVVGSRSPDGDGRWGQADLGGSMREWNLDWDSAGYPLPCEDCANLTPATARVTRGGFFSFGAENLRAAYRGGVTPSSHGGGIGLRCARD
jgi:formylglycine-generating enzyme required for sulfatase activity